MRIHGTSRAHPRRIALAAMVTLTAALAACSGSGGAGTPTASPTATTHHPATASAAAAPAASSTPPAAAASGLTGTWRGQYSGAYQGTFVLRWHQSGTSLSGKIDISNPPRTLSIHGSLTGGAIKFGTVGSYAITYSGSVSGNSMSGNYTVNAGGGSGGPWNASKA